MLLRRLVLEGPRLSTELPGPAALAARLLSPGRQTGSMQLYLPSMEGGEQPRTHPLKSENCRNVWTTCPKHDKQRVRMYYGFIYIYICSYTALLLIHLLPNACVHIHAYPNVCIFLWLHGCLHLCIYIYMCIYMSRRQPCSV